MAKTTKISRSAKISASAVRLAALAAFSAAAVLAGCFPNQGKQYPAPAVDTDAPDARTAYWRREYTKNRSVPPREFAVAPKPPRNNEFGEFDDNLYAGLDAQPSLPELPGEEGGARSSLSPGDYMPMTGGGYGETYGEHSAKPAGTRFTSSSMPRPRAAGTNAAERKNFSGEAGISAGEHFYPVEQLVFGGDYPDIDKPELYRLMPRDVVTVTVRDHPEFSGKLDIQADGTVRIANTPDLIRLRGLSVEEASEEIRRNLQPYVRGECIVRVQANRARGGYYFVFGDVNRPGRFPMGLEPVRLSDAILAANWEANPDRMAEDDELGPAFPAAGPRGRFTSPQSADLARVMLITPHRSQPVRTEHDIRSAMLGMTNNDPAIRPGQIIVVPSLDPQKNRSLGLSMQDDGVPVPPEALMPGRGFSGANTPARLPEVSPETYPARQEARREMWEELRENREIPQEARAQTQARETRAPAARVPARVSVVESNMARAYETQSTTETFNPAPPAYRTGNEETEYGAEYSRDHDGVVIENSVADFGGVVVEESSVPMGSRVHEEKEFEKAPRSRRSRGSLEGWHKGL